MATKSDRWQEHENPAGPWLIVARLGAAVLMSVLALSLRDSMRSPELLHLAAGAAGMAGTLTWVGGGSRSWAVLLFLTDIAWITLAVVASGSVDTGLTLLFPLVAFAAGLCVGGRTALVLSLLAGFALVASAMSISTEKHPGWIGIQGLLVLILGGVSDRTRGVMVSKEQALAFASHALETMHIDSESVVQNLGSGLLTLDRTGRVVHVNRAAERTLGIRGAEIKGRTALEALPPGARPLVDVLLRAMFRGEAARREEVELMLGSETVPVGVGVSLLSGNGEKASGVVGLFQDLTEVRRQESQERRRDRLAAVGELAAGIAHEIRNSVLPISGSVQILAQEVTLSEEQAKLFEIIERETENVERFVSAMLNYARSDAIRPVPFDLAEAALEASQTLRVSRQDAPSIRLEGEVAVALADPDQIRQALRNLVMNAADAAGSTGNVVLRTGHDAEGRPWIEVEDDGPGIPEKDKDRVFHPFVTGKPGGTGLGLPLAARIVEDHDGRIALLTAPGGGARFRIVLPAAAVEAAAG